MLPRQKLVGFNRVSLGVGRTSTTCFTIAANELALFEDNGDAKLFAGSHTLQASLGSPSGAVDDTVERVVEVEKTELLRRFEW